MTKFNILKKLECPISQTEHLIYILDTEVAKIEESHRRGSYWREELLA
jgi:hypothetical protein